MADTDGLLIAVTTAVITHKGRTYRIRRGDTVVRADDPVVQGRERLFKPLVVTHLGHRTPPPPPVAQVEEATAEPGQRRSVSRPRKPRGAKPGGAQEASDAG